MNNFLLHFIKSLRPKQSIKNIIIFIPILFSGSFFNYELLKISTLGFILFSFFVWLLYILNDVKDIDFDKIHPIKKFRPIASWDLNIKLWVYFSLLFMLIILILVYLIFWKIILYFFLIYFLNSLLYTIYLKNIVIVDVFFISFGFIIRWLIWIFLINSSISIWFLLILFLWSLFFWFLKRYQELQLDIISRKNIVLYNSDFLKQIISILTTLIIISYTFYTFNWVQSDLFFITVPFVLFWIIRYLYNIFYLENNLCWIDEIIYKDKFILLDIIIYFFIVFIIIYL